MAREEDRHGTRFDERDTIFSRIRLDPGTTRYHDYYMRKPEKREVDDEFRSGGPGQFADRMPEAAMVESTFGLITQLRSLVRGYPGEYRCGADADSVSGEEITRLLKQQASRYGAVFSEVIETEERFYYSFRGRGDRYGEKVENLLPRAMVFAVQMDGREIATAPGIREAVEVAGSYLRVAVPALAAAAHLRSLGYEAVAHIDGESEVVLPPMAARAGFGKIGRHGLLVSKSYGSLLRIAALTTDAPLEPGNAGDAERFPLEKACEACRKCADFCPSGAIPAGSIIERYDEEIRNVDHEACFSMWKKFGTDCGVCLAVCPYTVAAPPVDRGTQEPGSSAPGSPETRPPEPGSPDFLKRFMFGG
jgi:ferredoxin